MPCHINGCGIHKIVVLSLLQVQDPEGQADDLGPVADQNEEGVAGQLQEGGCCPGGCCSSSHASANSGVCMSASHSMS